MKLLVLCAMLAGVRPCGASDAPGLAPQITRQQLIGAWRLVRIDYSGPRGPMPDPFYRAGSTGLIVYDRSGWMSVQIAGPHRRAWTAAASRPDSAAAARDARLKAAAVDTYYAYFGTWDLDAAGSKVTHHVESSLIPAEDGVAYTQRVRIENGCMIFTNRAGGKGAQTIRRKVWERVGAAARCARAGRRLESGSR